MESDGIRARLSHFFHRFIPGRLLGDEAIMSFDLNAARKEQQERANAEFWAEDEAEAQLTAALDEIERLQKHQVGERMRLAERTRQRDAARELADKLRFALGGAMRWVTAGDELMAQHIITKYEAAKNPDGSWK